MQENQEGQKEPYFSVEQQISDSHMKTSAGGNQPIREEILIDIQKGPLTVTVLRNSPCSNRNYIISPLVHLSARIQAGNTSVVSNLVTHLTFSISLKTIVLPRLAFQQNEFLLVDVKKSLLLLHHLLKLLCPFYSKKQKKNTFFHY